MSENAKLSYLFSFNKRKNLSIICAVIFVIGAIATHFISIVIIERSANAYQKTHTPVLNADGWVKDLSVFHDKIGAYPKDLAELELKIWNSGDSSKPSKLTNGKNIYLFDNYLYMYNVDNKTKQICSFWAIPTGEYRQDSNTYLIILSPKAKQTWKGASLSAADIQTIPSHAVPLDTEMARLGMSLQFEDKSETTKPKSTFFQWGK